jgi:dihydroorotase
MKLHIQNGRLVDPLEGIDAQRDVFIAAGRIVGVGRAPEGFVANRVIDARNLVVAPGLVDLAARLREPGFEYKATLESEMRAAMAGGVTSLVCPPDTEPALDEPGLVQMLKHRARSLNQAHVYPLGALTLGLKGETLTEMAELTEAGCIGFSQANVPIADTNVLLHALEYAKTFGFTVWLRPQDAFLGRTGVAASGAVATRLGLPGVPVIAETVALYTIFEIVRATGAKVHLCRISSAAGLEMVRRARRENLPITADVGVHYIHLTDLDIGYFDAHCRLDPPLRGQRDRDAIREALLDGTIDAICSDHAPVDEDAKQLPFGEAEPGATGLELLLSLTLKWAAETDLPLSEALLRLTGGPARVIGGGCGRLAVGDAADLCIFDPRAHWRVEPRALKSQGHNTPFLGYELPGRVVMTVVGGHIGYELATHANHS